MQKINSNQLEATHRSSPKNKFGASIKEISVALGREDSSTDLMKRHPFDVAIVTLPPGKALCPYHVHATQWEFYHVLSGRGIVRDEQGETEVEPGDAFLFKPGEAHQVRNEGDTDFVYYVIADNPIGDHCYYPDSKKWIVLMPEKQLIRSAPLDYFDGEE
ncbi:cupin domain-containing protein [Pelagicoccus sp. SDUM812003]|uniref:cupin domain-containing protein n=1 Tax=Pelagicoccus sp. SDUM812003 TaxID=3041267 RepID=UPI00280EF0DE|nr:cupin domain-containing protein [Pelagicoccus sp. SDUM812003]MDQ8202464.1 cupin domain-containing protein [Pelagicoccus sp. SDUM812003]